MSEIKLMNASGLLEKLSKLEHGEEVFISNTMLTPHAINVLKSLIKISYILPLSNELNHIENESQYEYYNGVKLLTNGTYVKIDESLIDSEV